MIIYVLVDPRTEEVRYVGATRKSLDERLRIHVASAQLATNVAPRYVWLRELAAADVTPEILRIDACDEDDWAAYEDAWIAYFRESGDDLLNVKSGGGGPRSTAVRKRWTDEQKQRQSDTLKRAMQDATLRARIAESVREHAASRSLGEDREFRAKLSTGARKRYEDPQARQRTGDASRKAWQDPSMRKRHQESMQAAVAREVRVKCPGCDMVSRPGNIARHRKAKGH